MMSGMENVRQKKDKRHVLGSLGEDISAIYLKNKGFEIIGRNYRKKYGEIDLIGQKEGIVHFIEVKSVTCENLVEDVSHVTDAYRPEDNIHPQKLRRLARTIQAYLLEKFADTAPEWQFHAVVVMLNRKTKKARIRFLENLIL